MTGREVGELLRICRNRKGLTQEHLAKLLHVDQAVVSRIENSRETPDIDLVIRWAEVTDSREFLAIMLTGHEEWQQFMKIKVVFEQMRLMIQQIGA